MDAIRRRSGAMTDARMPVAPPLGPALEFLRTVWAVDHGLGRLSARMERTLGVTGPQRLAIRLIGRGNGIGPAELADLLHVHRSAATGIVRRLEAKKLVARRVHPEDARRWVLSLTEVGRSLDRDDRGTIESRVRQVLAASSPDETAAAARLLERLAGAFAVEG
jgi:DNA-binding MarR family transcriptional regulator